MIRRPPRSTRTDTLFPYTTLFRSNMLYMSSYSTANGIMQLTVTFKPGTNLDTAQVQVQNRVAIAEPRLPDEVRRQGITTTKQAGHFLMVVHLLQPDQRSAERRGGTECGGRG